MIAERRKKEAQREEMKKEEAFTTKFYSDSTLRCVDVLGLRSEVLCRWRPGPDYTSCNR